MNPFKAYDIRGIYPSQVNEALAKDIGKSLPSLLSCKNVIVGQDGRSSSDSLHKALVLSLRESGVHVISLGQCSTPQFYYALYSSSYDAGIMITASHNPKEYNGFKICKANGIPLFKENGLFKLESYIKHGQFKIGESKGHYIEKNIQEEYTAFFSKLLKSSYPFRVIVDCGNGMGTYEMKALRKLFPQTTFEVLYEDIDGEFPNHECNPVIEKYYSLLQKKLNEGDYDFGFAFDGDADRVTFFTKKGMIPPDLMTGILGCHLASINEKVGYEVRTSQVVKKILKEKNIIPCLYPSGHAYIKQHMREDGAVFAGEKSGHYFYQILHNTDSSLFSVMNLFHILSSEGKSLLEISEPLKDAYANSGELNYSVNDANLILKLVEKEFQDFDIKHIDGLSVYGEDFFFNIRKSNTESLVRLNIESTTRKKVDDLKEKIERVFARC